MSPWRAGGETPLQRGLEDSLLSPDIPAVAAQRHRGNRRSGSSSKLLTCSALQRHVSTFINHHDVIYRCCWNDFCCLVP